QKKTVMKTEFGYQKVVFEEDSKQEEQRETGGSNEQPSIEHQVLEEFGDDLKHEEQRGSGESEEHPITVCQVLEELKEDPEHEEQNKPRDFSEQPITEHKDQGLCFKEKTKRDQCCYDFSGYLYGDYED
ncbi:MAG: uncharacterized protein A8A55_3441, partial [Amphiamblys sp. WSBS2006]